MKAIKIIILISLLAVFFSSVSAENSAQTFLKHAIDDILTILKDPSYSSDQALKEKQKQILYERIEGVFAFDLLALGALGAKQKQFSKRQLAEFTHYFSKLITNTYFEKIAGNNIENVSILYSNIMEIKSKHPDIQLVDIDTVIVQEQLEIPVVYRMINQRNTQWKIYDIKIEGVSMTANYREQYRTRISDTPEDLISELKQKVEP